IGKVLRPLPAVEERTQAVSRADSKMVRALGADLQVLLEVLVIDDLRAARAFHPESLGDAAWLFGGRRDRRAGLLEPGHYRRLAQFSFAFCILNYVRGT